MTVSVIMAAYNVRPYVAEAVQSILSQSVADLELIVVDDGSTDGTDAVLGSFSDQRITVLRTANRGVCHARNLAMAQVKSGFVAVMDADDVSHPRRLECQLTLLRSRPDLVGVGCGVRLLEPSGRLVMEQPAEDVSQKVMAELYSTGGGLYPATCLMRASVVRAVGAYRPELPVSEDLDLLLRMSCHGTFANVREALYDYRLNRNSLTFQSKTRRDYYSGIALQLWEERKVTGADILDRGGSIEPYVPHELTRGSPYTIDHVLAYFHRQAAIESAYRGHRAQALARLAISLNHYAHDPKTWRCLAKLLLARRRIA